MYYRRKILLAILQAFGDELDKISLQKLLFLFSRQQIEKTYHFVPYKYGCYSFQANADLCTLTKYNIIETSGNIWKKIDQTNYIDELKAKDKVIIKYIVNQYKEYDKDDLVKLTYINYPYYAINSTIAATILNKDELAKVEKQKFRKNETVLFTIGYEGISLEEYINKLIINGVKVLCDVRRNPYSMKYGFCKSQLQKECNAMGIEYVHIPEVGIDSDKRQELRTQADYDKLFIYYKTDILKKELAKQKEILGLLVCKKRIALTCFEANICQCHRKHLAESISRLDGFNYEIRHI
jgi:uncharacterized protein (DUF488 family)